MTGTRRSLILLDHITDQSFQVTKSGEQATTGSGRDPGRWRVPVSLFCPVPLAKLKRIDLSSNFISSIDDDALLLLPDLQDLILIENQLAALPTLPTAIEVLDVRLNRLRSSGIQPGAFRVSQGKLNPIFFFIYSHF